MASVDVIILSWDRIDDTICAIESALGQTGVDIKVQVVDQGTAASELARLKAFCAADPRVELRC
ncbi:MAG: glycosyltransferase family 2 protein, partial [Pseudomonadota bacterium]